MLDYLAKKVKLELLDPRVLQAPLVKWEHLDQWVLLGCQGRGDALDPVVHQVSVVFLVTSENQVQWVPWVSMAHLDIQEAQE